MPWIANLSSTAAAPQQAMPWLIVGTQAQLKALPELSR